jgi:hypothetical protein
MLAKLTIQQEALPVVKSSLEMKRKVLEFNRSRYEIRLADFERRYQMTSEQFAARFETGELGDDADWFEWEFVLNAHREVAQQLKLLDSIHL